MMVDFFRRKMKFVIWAIIWAFTLSIFLIGAGSFFSNPGAPAKTEPDRAAEAGHEKKSAEPELDFSDPNPVAKVILKGQEEVITEGELNQAVATAKRQSERFRETPTGLAGLKATIGPFLLDRLIQDRLTVLEAKARSIALPEDVEQVLQDNYKRAGGKENLLAALRSSEDELRERIRHQLLHEAMVAQITNGKVVPEEMIQSYYDTHQDEFKDSSGSVQSLEDVRAAIIMKLRSTVTEDEIQAYYEDHKARWKLPDQVTLRHLRLDPNDDESLQAVTVTTAEVAEYYELHPKEFAAPRKVRLSHVFIDPDNEAFDEEASVTEEEAREAFEAEHPPEPTLHLQDLVVPIDSPSSPASRASALARVQVHLDRIKGGDSFASVAEEASLETEAKWDLPATKPSDLDAALESVAANLDVGQIGRVVAAGGMFHVLHLKSKAVEVDEVAREAEFSRLREGIVSTLQRRKRREAARSKIRELHAQLPGRDVDGERFAALAREASHAPSAVQGGSLGTIVLGKNPEGSMVDEIGVGDFPDDTVMEAVLDLSAGQVSQVVESIHGFHLIRVDEVFPVATRPLDEVASEISERLRRKKASEQARDLANKIRGSEMPFEEAIAKYSDGSDRDRGGDWGTVTLSTKEVPDIPEKILRETFSRHGLHPRIVSAIQDLPEGEISRPVPFGSSLHLFQVVKRLPLRFTPLNDDIREEIKDCLNPAVTEEELRSYFEQNRDEFRTPAKIKLQHVLLLDEETADEVLQKALRGEDFDHLARTYSRDATTASKGGTIEGDVKIPSIRAALNAAEPGRVYPELVKSPFGFHVLKLLSSEQAKEPTFEDVRATLEQRLTRQKKDAIFEAWISELRNQAQIKKLYPSM